jgi:hypothetical protein
MAQRLAVAWLGATILGTLLGCRDEPNSATKQEIDLVRYASLPGLQQSHDPLLRQEHARLISERATPAQLRPEDLAPPHDPSPSPRVESGDPAWTDVASILPPKTVDAMDRRLEPIYPPQEFQLEGISRTAARKLRVAYDEQRLAFRRLVQTPGFRFRVDHRRGLAADTCFVDAVRVVNRLEGLLVAELLESRRPAATMEPLHAMFRSVEALAAEQHLVPRLAAVTARHEALRVLAAVANDPQTGMQLLAQLEELVAAMLARWPPDADAWIGERAQGLHTYELIRDGYLLSVLTYSEIRALRDEVGIPTLAETVARTLDEDQLFYLQRMRQIIDSCRKPYWQRQAKLRELDSELDDRRKTTAYPFVADRILEVDVQQGQRLQALDLARCQAYGLALAAALGPLRATSNVNPLTGQTYEINRQEDCIVVAGVDPQHDEPAVRIRIPPP